MRGPPARHNSIHTNNLQLFRIKNSRIDISCADGIIYAVEHIACQWGEILLGGVKKMEEGRVHQPIQPDESAHSL